MTRLPRRAIPSMLLASAVAGPAAGQGLQIPLGNSSIVPQSAPTPAQTPAPFPSPVFTPAPAAPQPVATPRPTPTSTPRTTPSAAATPQPAPSPRAAPTPAARPGTRPIVAAAPVAASGPRPTQVPTAAPTPVAATTPRPAIETVVLPRPQRGPLWLWFAGAAALLLSLAALLFRRRGREPDAVQTDDEGDAAALESVSTPPLAMSSAQLTVTLNPTRAGLNLLTATVEADVIVANTGDTAAVDIRAGVDLDSAGAGGSNKQAPVGVFPPARPVVPPFALAPGEERRFRAVAALPHDAIRPLSAAGRPMFVPLITVQLGWTDAAGAQGAAQAWAIGIERPGSAKLAPFWLDVAPRSYDNVAARLTP